MAIDRLLLPRYAHLGKVDLPEIAEPQDAPIVIAGFGRYGQIVARMMLAQGIPCTVLDHDAEMIEAARSFGYRVFYGDASRLDLLRTAGAARAKVLVVAVDDVTHWNQLRDRGVMRVEREMFESSLRSARSVLELLGHGAHEARQTAMRFRQHNLELLERMHPHYKDRAKLIAVVKQGRRQLEEQMAQEREQRAERRPPGWDS